MTYNRKIIQLTLIFIGLFLIFATYFLYPKFNKIIVEKSIIEDERVTIDDTKSNTFKNVEYKGLYNIDNNGHKEVHLKLFRHLKLYRSEYIVQKKCLR